MQARPPKSAGGLLQERVRVLVIVHPGHPDQGDQPLHCLTAKENPDGLIFTI